MATIKIKAAKYAGPKTHSFNNIVNDGHAFDFLSENSHRFHRTSDGHALESARIDSFIEWAEQQGVVVIDERPTSEIFQVRLIEARPFLNGAAQ